jgi:O-antigen/teichoic acid export membrane protein
VADPELSEVPTDPAPTDITQRDAVLSGVARSLTRSTGLYAGSTAFAIPVGIVATIVTLWYLPPAQYAKLGLLMVLASFLTVMYNVGLLHGTFLWTYGSSGDGADDLEIDGMARTTMAGQRVAMGTGLIMTVIVVSAGTAVCFIFARPLASLLLGGPRYANLIGWTAISGGCGSIFRLTVNVFRFERRPGTFAIATAIRPVAVLMTSTGLLIAGYGLWGALMGTVLPTIACALGCMLATHRSYALRFSFSDLRQILSRGSTVVIPVVALFIVHSGDLYLLSVSVHGAQLGVYRLASRLGSPPSYFVAAAYQHHGQDRLRSVVNTYYVLVGLAICVAFVCFSRLLIVIAPPAYHEAANIVPLISFAFVLYGGYIVLLRTTRPDRLLLWYGITAVLAAVTFIGTGLALIPVLGSYGPPVALITGLVTADAVVVWRNSVKEDPLPIQWRRMTAGFLVACGCSGLALAGSTAGPVLAGLTTAVATVAFLPGLVISGAVPRSHLPLLRSVVVPHRTSALATSPAQLPAAEQTALAAFRTRRLSAVPEPLEYARLTRALRRLGGIGMPSSVDLEIGRYLASPEPEAIRDFAMNDLIGRLDVDPYELHRLDQLAKAVRRRRHNPLELAAQPAWRSVPGALRRRYGPVPVHDRQRLERAQRRLVGAGSPDRPLDLVRAVRDLRHAVGRGGDPAADYALVRALRGDPGPELNEFQRTELRWVRRSLARTRA